MQVTTRCPIKKVSGMTEIENETIIVSMILSLKYSPLRHKGAKMLVL
jgi:hypothetical protein